MSQSHSLDETPENFATGPGAVGRASALLADGEIVALPTETVYGLAADATNGKAVAKIFSVKGRPQFNPLICHVDSAEMVEEFADFDPVSRQLAKEFWPGPLTLVLPLLDATNARTVIHPLVTAGLDTVAVRMPKGPSKAIISALGRPLAAPSANVSGKISPTTAQAVYESLRADASLIVDGGPCAVGLESTIVRVENGRLHILRPGGIDASALEDFVKSPVQRRTESDAITAPGQLSSHYSPNARVRLNVASVSNDEALLAFGPTRAAGYKSAFAVRNLSESGDLIEAASNLFEMLRELDQSGVDIIAVEPIPGGGIGEAINDRLVRAAADRSDAGPGA